MKIGADIIIADLMEKVPGAEKILAEHGTHCPTCAMAKQKTLREMAMRHNADLDTLLADLNKAAEQSLIQTNK